jgi:TonB family protein
LWVSEDGRVMSTAVAETSGRPELDAAAVKVAESARFTPGAGGWVLLPLEFSPK